MAYLEDFLKTKYAEYVSKEVELKHRVPSMADFAKYLGVSNASLSQWMTGQRPPIGDNLNKVAKSLGPEVYDILGQPRLMPDDPLLLRLAVDWHKLSDENARKMLAMFNTLIGEGEREDNDRKKPRGAKSSVA